MIRALFICAIATVPILLALRPAPPPVCPNTIHREPLVLYDQSGGTIGGTFDFALAAYNDGSARLSRSFFGQSQSALVYPGPDAIHQLVFDLGQLGAGTLCDNFVAVADLPPTTLTLHRDGTDVRARTFSWYLSDGQYGAIDQRMQTFIQTYFPNF